MSTALAPGGPPAAPSAADGPLPVKTSRRRGKRWLRLVVPYAVVLFLLLVSVLAYVIEEPDPDDRAFLSPVSSKDIGASDLAGRLRQGGVAIERFTRTPDALRAADRGDAVLFIPTPDLMHTLYLRMLKLMPESTTVVMVRPGNDTLVRGYLPVRMRSNRWASTTAAPGCGYEPAVRAGRAGVRRATYISRSEPAATCYAGSLLVGAPHHDTSLTLVGSADPFRNDRIGEHGNADLAVGLLSGARRVIWLDLHDKEPGPKVHEGQPGLDGSPAPADLGVDGNGEPDPDFQVPDPDGKQPKQNDDPPPAASDEPSMFDLFPATAWTVLAVLAVAAALAAAARARRLGTPVHEPLPVLVPATETVTGRGRLYERSRDRGAALGVLRRAARDRITHALDLPPDAGREVLLPAVVAQTGFDAAQVDAVLFVSDPETNDDLVHLAAALEILVDTVTRIPEGETRD